MLSKTILAISVLLVVAQFIQATPVASADSSNDESSREDWPPRNGFTTHITGVEYGMIEPKERQAVRLIADISTWQPEHIQSRPLAWISASTGLPPVVMLWEDGRILWSNHDSVMPPPDRFFDRRESAAYFGPYFEAWIGEDRVTALLNSIRESEMFAMCETPVWERVPFGGNQSTIYLEADGQSIQLLTRYEIARWHARDALSESSMAYIPGQARFVSVAEEVPMDEWLETHHPEYAPLFECWFLFRDLLFDLIPDEDSDIEIKELGMVRLEIVRHSTE